MSEPELITEPKGPREFIARYSAPCKVCGQDVKGQRCTWIRTKVAENKGYVHVPHCLEQYNAGKGTAPIAAAVDPMSTQEPKHNGADRAVLDGFADAIWSRIESRVKDIETGSEELAANVEAQLEAFKTGLSAKVQPVPQVIQLQVTRPELPEPLQIDNAHALLPKLINLMNRCRNNAVSKWPYLWDATGGGKSYAVPQAAELLGLRYASQSYNSQTPDYLIMGYNDANGNYVPSLFYDYYKHGGVYGGEELDDGSADLLVTLNVPLSNGHMTFPNRERVPRHPDFIFVGCGNTPGRGPTPRYPERKPFDAAFATRFFFIRWTYDTALEQSIALSINPSASRYVQWVQQAREAVTNLGLRLELTPRTSFVLAELSLDPMFSDEDLLDGVTAGIDETAKSKLLDNVPFPARD